MKYRSLDQVQQDQTESDEPMPKDPIPNPPATSLDRKLPNGQPFTLANMLAYCVSGVPDWGSSTTLGFTYQWPDQLIFCGTMGNKYNGTEATWTCTVADPYDNSTANVFDLHFAWMIIYDLGEKAFTYLQLPAQFFDTRLQYCANETALTLRVHTPTNADTYSQQHVMIGCWRRSGITYSASDPFPGENYENYQPAYVG